jgi:threonine dehydrogenase-like Zn-dependent dehydrogenase
MFAGQFPERGKVHLTDVPDATIDGPGQVIFQPSTTCLCGSDLPYFDGFQVEYPLRPGLSLHEMVGTVTESTSDRFHEGDHVLAVPTGQVGFFERYTVSERRVMPVDPRIEREEIAVLAQPLGTAIFGLKKIPNWLDQDVVIVGQGPMGQTISACLRNMGARRIIAIDVVASRLERCASFGATHVINAADADPVEAVREITDGALADVVIECVGHRDQTLDLCTHLCRHAGKILCFGVPPDSVTVAPWRALFNKNISIHTTVDPDFDRDFPLAMQWIAEGRLDLSKLITHRFELSDVQEAFETFRDKKDGALKVMLTFPGDPDPGNSQKPGRSA